MRVVSAPVGPVNVALPRRSPLGSTSRGPATPAPRLSQEKPFQRDTPRSIPDAMRSPLGSTARADGPLLDPRGNKEEPFQRAVPGAQAPPARRNGPPATRSPLGS